MHRLVPMTDGVTILVAKAGVCKKKIKINKTSLKYLRPSNSAGIAVREIAFSLGSLIYSHPS